jgi:hypothetical protein
MDSIENLFDRLSKSTEEEEISDIILIIMKGFSVDTYRDVICKNPYYKSIAYDLKIKVFEEMAFYRNSIKNEITEIDNELVGSNNEYLKKLKSLRSDCVSLLNELSLRETDLKGL